MFEQHIFGRNGGVGLKLENEMAVGPLPGDQRLGCGRDCVIERAGG